MKGLLDSDLAATPTRLPKRTKVRGTPHHLAYINDDEAALLRARGGGVTPGGGQKTHRGVLSFDTGDGDGGGGDGPGADSANSEASTQDAGADPGADPSAGAGPGAAGPGGSNPGGVGDPADNGFGGSVANAIGDAMSGYGFSGEDGPPGTGTTDSDGGGWNSGSGIGEGGRGGGWGTPPPWWGQQAPSPAFVPQMNAQPVYTARPVDIPPALQGTTPGGFLAGQEAFRALAGYQRPAQAPQAPVAPPQGPQQGAWAAPPPLRPLSPYPQAPILTGQGGNGAYYDAWNRMSDRPAPGFFDMLGRYRGW